MIIHSVAVKCLIVAGVDIGGVIINGYLKWLITQVLSLHYGFTKH